MVQACPPQFTNRLQTTLYPYLYMFINELDIATNGVDSTNERSPKLDKSVVQLRPINNRPSTIPQSNPLFSLLSDLLVTPTGSSLSTATALVCLSKAARVRTQEPFWDKTALLLSNVLSMTRTQHRNPNGFLLYWHQRAPPSRPYLSHTTALISNNLQPIQ
jgi:hypothetical protein